MGTVRRPKKKTTAELYGLSSAPDQEAVEKSLMDQLWRQGADIDAFRDLVYDYLKFWSIKDKLQRDVAQRGVSYLEAPANRPDAPPIWKQNPSVKDLVMINKQMLSVLAQLNLNPKTVSTEDGDDL